MHKNKWTDEALSKFRAGKDRPAPKTPNSGNGRVAAPKGVMPLVSVRKDRGFSGE